MAYSVVGWLTRPWMLILALGLLQPSSAQFCSFWTLGCIDALAQVAVPLDFSPLFADPITLFYSFDSSKFGKGDGPMTKTAFWLGYKNHNVNPNIIETNTTSEVALRVGNLTGTPAGGNNGCDGIWGEKCSHNIKTALQQSIFNLVTSHKYYSQPLATVLNEYLIDQPDLEECGPHVFDVAAIPVQDFAYEEFPSREVTIMKPGSGYHPWQVWYLDDMTDAKQASQVAVGIISRAPCLNGIPPLSPDGIQIELVCLQAPQGPPTGSSKDHD